MNLPRTALCPSLSFRALLSNIALLAASATASAQVVQLPEYGVFMVDTTVLVPDRGATYVGGVGRASSMSSSSGVPGLGHLPGVGRGFQNRAIGHEVAGSGAWVGATIIDLNEWDEAVLAAAGGSRPADAAAANRQAALLSQHVGRRPANQTRGGELLLSVAEIRRHNQAASQEESTVAAQYFADGQAAEAEGKYGIARIYYRMALGRATGELADEIGKRMASLPAQGGSSQAQ